MMCRPAVSLRMVRAGGYGSSDEPGGLAEQQARLAKNSMPDRPGRQNPTASGLTPLSLADGMALSNNHGQ